MFIRVKGVWPLPLPLQIAEDHREKGRVVQRVLCALGRVDKLTASGGNGSLLRSLARFSQRVQVVEDYQQGELQAESVSQIGPDLAPGRLWQTTGVQEVLQELLQCRRFGLRWCDYRQDHLERGGARGEAGSYFQF